MRLALVILALACVSTGASAQTLPSVSAPSAEQQLADVDRELATLSSAKVSIGGPLALTITGLALSTAFASALITDSVSLGWDPVIDGALLGSTLVTAAAGSVGAIWLRGRLRQNRDVSRRVHELERKRLELLLRVHCAPRPHAQGAAVLGSGSPVVLVAGWRF